MTTKTGGTPYFRIKHLPDQLCLVSGVTRMLERYSKRFVIDLTICLAEKEGQELLGLDKSEVTLAAPFEVALMGSTDAHATVTPSGPSGVRLLGRFTLNDPYFYKEQGLKISEAILELHKWQWEVVFNPIDRHDEAIGFVNRLDTPLPEEWTR